MNWKSCFLSVLLSPALVLLLPNSGVQAASTSPLYSPEGRLQMKAYAHPNGRTLNHFQKERLRGFLSGVSATLDTLRLIAIQVQFSDSLMGGQEGSHRSALRDSLYFANELKHLTDYYRGASRDWLSITWEVTSRLYTLDNPMGYYGNDALEETRVVEMMEHVIELADDDVDFSLYDTVVLIHAGAGQETDILDDSREQIWSSFYDREDIDDAFPDSTVEGLVTGDSLGGSPFLVDNFIVLPSDASQDGNVLGTLGIWAFETGSRLGLLSLFDNEPEEFPDSRGIGNFCLMSYGLFNALAFVPAFPCAFNRILAGWIDPLLVEEDGHFRLGDVNSPAGSDTVCLKLPVTESEYFLIVNRVHDTNFDSLFTFIDRDSNLIPDNTDSLGGAEFDFFLTDLTNPFVVKPDPDYGGLYRKFVSTGSGIYVWHIDEAVIRGAIDAGFLPNDFVFRKGVDLEEADGVQDLDRAGDAYSFGGYFDSFRQGNNDHFGPFTDPSSMANSGARTGIVVGSISPAGPYMECDIAFSRMYDETRIRWEAFGGFQPPTPVNLDGGDTTEIVVFADTGRAYAFLPSGREFDDRDQNPQTIEPYLEAPGAVWAGPPAFGDLDGVPGIEIVAASRSGRLYGWDAAGGELVDGDGDPTTDGVLYSGSTLVAPPMLIPDLSEPPSGGMQVAVVERIGDSLYVSFIDAGGNKILPSDFPSLWPLRIQAQFASPMAYGILGETEGLVIAWIDTIRALYGLSYGAIRELPQILQSSGYSPGDRTLAGDGEGANETEWSVTFAVRGDGRDPDLPTSPLAVGDLDADGVDEIVFSLPDGRLVIHARTSPDGSSGDDTRFVALRGENPSAPALGDLDMDGTLEIALWDNAYLYLFEHNGALCTGWPKPIRPVTLQRAPPLPFDNLRTSPLIGDMNGDGQIEILFPQAEGTVYAFRASGAVISGYPRVALAGSGAAPSLCDLLGDGELSYISLGTVEALTGRNAPADTSTDPDRLILSMQSLPGSRASDELFWPMYQRDTHRTGRARASVALQEEPEIAESGSFMIYPNPVGGGELHARVLLNRRARVRLEIYNIEGERAVSLEFVGNPGGIIRTPFDQVIDVAGLKSGVYFLRLHLEGAGGSSAFVKPFAIKR